MYKVALIEKNCSVSLPLPIRLYHPSILIGLHSVFAET